MKFSFLFCGLLRLISVIPMSLSWSIHPVTKIFIITPFAHFTINCRSYGLFQWWLFSHWTGEESWSTLWGTCWLRITIGYGNTPICTILPTPFLVSLLDLLWSTTCLGNGEFPSIDKVALLLENSSNQRSCPIELRLKYCLIPQLLAFSYVNSFLYILWS